MKVQNNYKLLDYLGKENNDTGYKYIEKITDGYYMVISDSEELNCVGLVDSNGKELISCEAAVIDKMQNYGDTTGSNRYVKVLYAGEVTTNEADAILYSTNDMISFGISGWQS